MSNQIWTTPVSLIPKEYRAKNITHNGETRSWDEVLRSDPNYEIYTDVNGKPITLAQYNKYKQVQNQDMLAPGIKPKPEISPEDRYRIYDQVAMTNPANPYNATLGWIGANASIAPLAISGAVAPVVTGLGVAGDFLGQYIGNKISNNLFRNPDKPFNLNVDLQLTPRQAMQKVTGFVLGGGASHTFQPFHTGYNLVHSIGRHPLQRWDMLQETRNLLKHKLITLDEALEVPRVKIGRGEFKWMKDRILLPRTYRRSQDGGFNIRHEIAHQTQNDLNLKEFKESPVYSDQYRYDYGNEYALLDRVEDRTKMLKVRLSEQRADWLGTLGGRTTMKQAMGLEPKSRISQMMQRALYNPQLFKDGYGNLVSMTGDNALAFHPDYKFMLHLDYGNGKGAFTTSGAYTKGYNLYPGKGIKLGEPDYTWWNENSPYALGKNGKLFTRAIVIGKDDIPHLIPARKVKAGQGNFLLKSEYVTPSPVDLHRSVFFELTPGGFKPSSIVTELNK